jgi:lysyl endopeptidase
LSDFAGKSDVTLVEIDEVPPPSYDLFLNGWDRSDFVPSSAVSIHHPQNHGKRITFENDETPITGISSPSGDTHFEVDWDEGTTEGGSSGGPLFAPSKKIVGVLSGGGAGCNITDYYGRIHDAWTGGGTPDTRLQDWLDPMSTGVKTLDGRPLAPPPPPVSNFQVENVSSTSATLSWKVPTSLGSPTPTTYDLRIQPDSVIEDEIEFENARRISMASLGTPGERQSVEISLNPDTSYYFAIRTLTDAKNASSVISTKQEEDATPVKTLRVKQAPSPNPTGSEAWVKVSVEESQTVKLTVYDILGRRVGISKSRELTPFRLQEIPIDVSSLSSGVYFLRIKGTSITRTEKIIVRR